MVRLRLALAVALGVLLLTPQAAAGGGWWSYIHVDRSLVAPGDRVELHAVVAFRSEAAAEAGERSDRFRVYLLRGFDDSVLERAMRKSSPGNWWSLGGAEAIEVGQVTISGSDPSLRRATAVFTVPDVPPATYHLMLCDTGCAEPLPDVIPTEGFTVVADPAMAWLAERVDRLERRSRKQADRLAAARADTHKELRAARNARADVEQLQAKVTALADEDRSAPPIWAYAGWLAAGALTVLALRRLPPRPAEWQPSDEELQELLTSEPRTPRFRPTPTHESRRG